MGEHCSPTVKLSHRTCMGAAQFLLCRNATSRYFLPVELLVNVTKMYPKIIWHQRYDKHGIIPPNGTPRASSPTMFRASLLCRKIATLFADFTLCYGIEKAVQSFSLRHRFVFGFLLFIRGYPYTFCPLPPILDSRQDTVSRLPDFRLHTQISDLPAR